MIESKIKLNDFMNHRNCNIGLYMFRAVTKLPMSVDVVKNAIINGLEAEIEGSCNNNVMNVGYKDELIKRVELLKDNKVILYKEDKFVPSVLYDGDTFIQDEVYYYQMALQVKEENREKLGDVLHEVISKAYNNYSYREDKTWCPKADMVFQLIEVGSSRTKTLISTDNSFNVLVQEGVFIPAKNICMSIELDTKKKYNRNSVMKVGYNFYSSWIEAMKHKASSTAYIADFGTQYPVLEFITQANYRNGSMGWKQLYKSTPKLDFRKNLGVFWDGAKSREMIEPYLDKLEKLNIQMLNVIQFSSEKDFFYSDMRTSGRARKVILHFLSREKLYTSQYSIRNERNGIAGQILCAPVKGEKKKIINLALTNNSGYTAELIIPVDDKNSQEKALELACEMIYKKLKGEDFSAEFSEYKNILLGFESKEDDVLSKWFSYCTRSIRNTDDSIVRTYVNMKKALEREYKEIGSYLQHYDFNCQPIPRVLTDKKILENYYKCLQIEPKNIIIKSINNKKIKPIEELQPTVKFMVHGHKQFQMGEFPLNKCLNTKTNEIELYYNKMKGEVTHVKTQNWR